MPEGAGVTGKEQKPLMLAPSRIRHSIQNCCGAVTQNGVCDDFEIPRSCRGGTGNSWSSSICERGQWDRDVHSVAKGRHGGVASRRKGTASIARGLENSALIPSKSRCQDHVVIHANQSAVWKEQAPSIPGLPVDTLWSVSNENSTWVDAGLKVPAAKRTLSLAVLVVECGYARENEIRIRAPAECIADRIRRLTEEDRHQCNN